MTFNSKASDVPFFPTWSSCFILHFAQTRESDVPSSELIVSLDFKPDEQILQKSCFLLCRLLSFTSSDPLQFLWTFWWALSLVNRLNCFERTSQTYGFSPEWILKWAFNELDWVKLDPHSLHLYGFRPWDSSNVYEGATPFSVVFHKCHICTTSSSSDIAYDVSTTAPSKIFSHRLQVKMSCSETDFQINNWKHWQYS